jgi:hypothetical protein
VDFALGDKVHILVRLSEAMKEYLGATVTGDAGTASRFAREWPRLHAMCLGSLGLDDDIRGFINYLDEKVTQVVSPSLPHPPTYHHLRLVPRPTIISAFYPNLPSSPFSKSF